jgi:radical SAM superfamily enzyme YgiQ (UPF0313 family)
MACMTFLAPTPPDLSAFGVRALSAYLRLRGHETRIVFLPGSIGRLRSDGGFAYEYGEETLARAVALCVGSDLVGISFMTPYFDRAVQLTARVRAAGLPVVWGGIHPTVRPDEGLAHADFVCVGEGEEALDALLRDMGNATAVPGIRTRHGGGGRTGLMPDLDALPFVDFSCKGHFVINEDGANRVLDDRTMESLLPLVPGRGGRLLRAYRIMTDRGCPHNCAYCSVPAVKRMFGGDAVPYHRQRSPGHVLDELEAVKVRFPSMEAVQFFDDTFFAKPLRWFEEFAPAYTRRIGLPFYCQGSPATIDDRRLDLLLDAGLVFVEMGVQTGSPRMREIFRRQDSDRTVTEAATRIAARRIHDRQSGLLPPVYHIIIDSPWETPDDLLATVRLLAGLPRPFGLAISSLVFFPGTELHDRAVAEGLLADETSQVYRRPFYVPPRTTYAGFLLYLLSFPGFPAPLMRRLLGERWVAFFGRRDCGPVYRTGYALGEGARLAAKGMQALRARDFRRIGLWLTRRFGADRGPGGRMA